MNPNEKKESRGTPSEQSSTYFCFIYTAIYISIEEHKIEMLTKIFMSYIRVDWEINTLKKNK